MVRCLSLLGMMVFALGVFALASAVPSPPLPQLPPPDDNPKSRGKPGFATLPALAFHARFSLN